MYGKTTREKRQIKRIILIIYSISLLALLTHCQQEERAPTSPSQPSVLSTVSSATPAVAEVLAQTSPTPSANEVPAQTSPTPEVAQIIEQDYGQLPRTGLYTYFVPPDVDPSLPIEKQREQLNEIRAEQSARAQDLYQLDYYFVSYEFAHPLFNDVFPETHLYAVVTNANETGDVIEYTTMVSMDEKDYRMPLDFNQLMVDAGYQLTTETRDKLGQAFIISGMPTEMASETVTCTPGHTSDKQYDSLRFVYEIECQVAYQDIGTVIALFYPFEDLFTSVGLGWGPLNEDGFQTQGFVFGSNWIAQ